MTFPVTATNITLSLCIGLTDPFTNISEQPVFVCVGSAPNGFMGRFSSKSQKQDSPLVMICTYTCMGEGTACPCGLPAPCWVARPPIHTDPHSHTVWLRPSRWMWCLHRDLVCLYCIPITGLSISLNVICSYSSTTVIGHDRLYIGRYKHRCCVVHHRLYV